MPLAGAPYTRPLPEGIPGVISELYSSDGCVLKHILNRPESVKKTQHFDNSRSACSDRMVRRMTITAFRNPAVLAFSDYTVQGVVTDPNDGSAQDAFTSFNFELLPNLPPEHHNGRFRMPRTMSISITPIALLRSGAPQTAGLLAHEQLHYDVGFVIARQLAREFNIIDAATDAALRTTINQLIQLHFHTRARLIQTRYDRESNHGLNAHFQRVWSQNMRGCLANPHASQIGGWML